MFRRLSHTLPADRVFPHDLEQLGFFVNDEDQIRKINNPSEKYQYKISSDDRVNQLHREANNGDNPLPPLGLKYQADKDPQNDSRRPQDHS